MRISTVSFQITKPFGFVVTSVLFFFTPQKFAFAEGFNSENFTPHSGSHSGILWENSDTAPHKSFSLRSTFSYAHRPLELGNNSGERIAVVDDQLISHVSASYGIAKFAQISTNLPLAIYTNANSVSGYLRNANSKDRNSFFFGDWSAAVKLSSKKMFGDLFQTALSVTLVFPTGNREAFLTDDSFKSSISLPSSFKFNSGQGEFFFTPGFTKWEAADRVYAFPNDNSSPVKLLEKSYSLSVETGVRQWFTLPATTPRAFVFDGGIRGEFSNARISLTNPESPLEWSAGVGYKFNEKMQINCAVGSGIGDGAGAPLRRMLLGFEFTKGSTTENLGTEDLGLMLSSSAYSDAEFEQIMERAMSEPIPPTLGDEDVLLRLKVNGQVFDIGAVEFDFNSSKLKTAAKSTIAELRRELSRFSIFSIKIEGHTDSIGSYSYNLVLSKRRAEAVKAELVRQGETGTPIETEGFSYKLPIASNATKLGRSQNRRIEVSINGESFRNPILSDEEKALTREWIAPGGKKPSHD